MRKPITVPVASLVLDAENANCHSPEQLRAIADSLKNFGQQKSILIDESHRVIAGNGTLQAAKLLGWTEVRAIVSPMTAREFRGYAITDNQVARYSKWFDTNLIDPTPPPREPRPKKIKIPLELDESRRLDVVLWLDSELQRLGVTTYEDVFRYHARGRGG